MPLKILPQNKSPELKIDKLSYTDNYLILLSNLTIKNLSDNILQK
jgi:hypothetical protein